MRPDVITRCLFVGLVANPLTAYSAVPDLDTVFQANDPADVQCAYSRIEAVPGEDGGRTLERFDGQWRLLAVDDSPPDADALEDYAAGADARAERRHPHEFDLAKLVIADTVQWTETTTGTVLTFGLRPEDPDDAEMAAHTEGRAELDAHARLRRFVVRNTAPVKPAAMVRIDEFLQTVEFMDVEGVAFPLRKSAIGKIRGKAFGLKTISQDRRVEYADYDCRSVSSPSPVSALESASD